MFIERLLALSVGLLADSVGDERANREWLVLAVVACCARGRRCYETESRATFLVDGEDVAFAEEEVLVVADFDLVAGVA